MMIWSKLGTSMSQDERCTLGVSCFGVAVATLAIFLATKAPFPAFASMAGNNPALPVICAMSPARMLRRPAVNTIQFGIFLVALGLGVLIDTVSPPEPAHLPALAIVAVVAYALGTYALVRMGGRALLQRCAQPAKE